MWLYGPVFDFPIQDHITILHLFKEGKTNLNKGINKDYSVKIGFMHFLLGLLYLFINLDAIVNAKLLKRYIQNWS